MNDDSPKQFLQNIDQPRVLRYFFIVLGIGILGNVLFTMFTINSDVFESLKALSVPMLFATILLAIFPWFTNALRVVIWTRFIGTPVKYRDCLRLVIASEMGAAITPTAVGGGYVKLGMLMQKGVKAGEAVSLTVLSSTEDMIFFVFALIGAFFVLPASELPYLRAILNVIQSKAHIIIIVLLFLILLGFVIAKFSPAFSRFLRKRSTILHSLFDSIKKSFHDFVGVFQLIKNHGKLRFLLSMIITSVQWSARYSIFTVLVLGLHQFVHPVLSFFMQCIVFGTMNFIPTPGATVGAEATFFVIYKNVLSPRMIGLAMLGWRFFTYYFQLGLGSIVVSVLSLKKNEDSPEDVNLETSVPGVAQ